MEQRMNERKKIVYILLGFIIMIQLALIVYEFAFKKDGWHSDEMWSYGYANSYYQKDIFQDQDGNVLHYGEWTDTQVLKDYFVVNEGETFQYDSIYQNQINDLSPPLHSMILHTICSFFPEKFSLWYGFSINVVAFVISMIFLFKTAQLLKGDLFALCCCVLFGFTVGARDTFIYLRMYALCTAMILLFLYNLLAYIMTYNKDRKLFTKHLLVLCVVSFSGFLTHYYMISFIGIFTFGVCTLLLLKKKIKLMFTYGLSMLSMLLISIAVFPSLIRMSQYQGEKVSSASAEMLNYTFELRFRIIANFITQKIFNIDIIYGSGILKIALGVFVFMLIVSIPLLFLLRNTKVVKNGKRKIVFVFMHVKSIFRYCVRRIRWFYIILVGTIVLQIIVVGETSNVYGMGKYEDRYIMFLYPLATLIGVALIYWVVGLIVWKRNIRLYVLIGCTILLAGMNLYNHTVMKSYFFETDVQGETVEESIKNKDVIYIMHSSWLLTAYAPYLLESNQFFQVSRWDYKEYEEKFKEKLEDRPIVLLIDASFLKDVKDSMESAELLVVEEQGSNREKKQEDYEQILAFFEDLEPTTKMEKLSTEIIFTRKLEAYLINP